MSFKIFSFNDWLSEGGAAGLRSFVLNNSYERMCWVYACVNRIATSASSAPLVFYQGKPSRIPSDAPNEKERIKDREHPVYKLFNPPNPPTIISLKQLMYRTFVHVSIDGLVFWVIERKKGIATSIDIRLKAELQPILVYTNADPSRPQLRGWEDSSGKKYLPEDVLPLDNYNPKNALTGLSQLSPSRMSLESEYSIAGWNSAFFRSGMKNPLLIQAKGQLTREQKKDIRNEVVNYYSGIDGAHGALLMQGGVEVKPLVVNPKDVDFIRGKELNREEVLAVFGVPPSIVGIFSYSNYCLTADALVTLEENIVKPIVDIRPNDKVLSMGVNNIETATVIHCWEAGYKDVCVVETKLRKIKCSLQHRFLRKIKNSDCTVVMEWIPAEDLSLSDEIAIVNTDENLIVLTNDLPQGLMWDTLKSISVFDEQELMYDLEIEGTHNYFANGIVTHNSNVREQIRIFWEHTLLPKMNHVLELIQFNILDRDFPGVYAQWDVSKVAGLAPDPVELAAPASQYHSMGYSPSQTATILKCPALEPDKDFEKPEPIKPQMPAANPEDPSAEKPKKPKDPNAGDPKPSEKPKPDNNNSYLKELLTDKLYLFAVNAPLPNTSRKQIFALWQDLVISVLQEKFKGFDFLQFDLLPEMLCQKPTEEMRQEFIKNGELVAEKMLNAIYKASGRS